MIITVILIIIFVTHYFVRVSRVVKFAK